MHRLQGGALPDCKVADLQTAGQGPARLQEARNGLECAKRVVVGMRWAMVGGYRAGWKGGMRGAMV